jgi:glycosyltransferase involved in cell wall biosynthesis
MIVCYFGIYKKDYTRNNIFINGLTQNGIKVIECQSSKKGLKKYFDLFIKHWKIRKKYDILIVGFPGQSVVWLAKLISNKKIIFDAFLSFYDSMIFDRKTHKSKSLMAMRYWLLDWISIKLANIILLDTQQHVDYFVKTFKVKTDKCRRIFVGANDQIFKPLIKIKHSNKKIIHFHGNFIPLQGIKYIIKAADILRDDNYCFRIIGQGQEFKMIKDLVNQLDLQNNISFIDPVSLQELPQLIADSDLCLGIFGDTNKTQRVIPNKVYEYLACAKPIITAETPAMKELFDARAGVIFCRAADASDLAKKIREAFLDIDLLNSIAADGHEVFKRKVLPQKLVQQLIKILEEVK